VNGGGLKSDTRLEVRSAGCFDFHGFPRRERMCKGKSEPSKKGV